MGQNSWIPFVAGIGIGATAACLVQNGQVKKWIDQVDDISVVNRAGNMVKQGMDMVNIKDKLQNDDFQYQ